MCVRVGVWACVGLKHYIKVIMQYSRTAYGQASRMFSAGKDSLKADRSPKSCWMRSAYFHLAVACDVFDGVFLCCPFSHKMSWMRSET